MHNLYFSTGLSNPQNLHQLIVKDAQDREKGVFLMIIDSDEDTNYKKLKNVIFAEQSDFQFESESNEDKIKNTAITQSMRMYEPSYQYFVMFKINQLIVGGAFVPFDQSVELELAIDQAIQTYDL